MVKYTIEVAEAGTSAGLALWQTFDDGSRKLVFAGSKEDVMLRMADLIEGHDAAMEALRTGVPVNG